jgi:plasmid stability protein
MPTLYVREVPEKIYNQVQRIAEKQGRSLSAYVITILEQAVEEEKARARQSQALANMRRRRRPLPPGAPDSVEMIRRMRDADE